MRWITHRIGSAIVVVIALVALSAQPAGAAVIQNGAAYAWGYNGYGQVGDGTTITPRTTPVAVSGMSIGVSAIAAGAFHSLAVQNGAVYAWGGNGSGQLGDGTTTQRLSSVAVDG